MSIAGALAQGAAGGPGWVTRVDRMWMLPTFRKALAKREKETVLLRQLDECIEQLFANPLHGGLNLETLRVVGQQPVMSVRIGRGPRVILTPLGRGEVGLLYFDQHEEAYRWVERNGEHVPKMLSKVAEVRRGAGVRAAPVAFPSEDEDTPLAIASAEQFQKMVREGIAHYMTWLDDDQISLVQMQPKGLLLVKGGAGTGKTAVAVHRLLKLTEKPPLVGPKKVLYLCFNHVLAHTVGQLVHALRQGQMPADLEIRTFHSWCGALLQQSEGLKREVNEQKCRRAVAMAYGRLAAEQRKALAGLTSDWVAEEIEQVIVHNGIAEREKYLQITRTGRGVRIKQPVRAAVWEVYERSEETLEHWGYCRYADVPKLALQALEAGDVAAETYAYRAVVIDEGQDCSPVMVRVARALLKNSGGLLTVFADPAQAIYENGWAWTQAELRPRGGDTHILKKNYRTTREIYALTRPLLDADPELVEDVKEMEAPARHGPKPVIVVARTEDGLRQQLVERVVEASKIWEANQIGVLAPNRKMVASLREAISQAGAQCKEGGGNAPIDAPGVHVTTIHSAKGLDFPVVFLWGPHWRDLGGRWRAELAETRHVLYVALTRAGAELTIGVVAGQHHPLLVELAGERYEIVGDARTSSGLSGASSGERRGGVVRAGVEDWSWLESARASEAEIEE